MVKHFTVGWTSIFFAVPESEMIKTMTSGIFQPRGTIINNRKCCHKFYNLLNTVNAERKVYSYRQFTPGYLPVADWLKVKCDRNDSDRN